MRWRWLHSPALDLGCFCFSWLPVTLFAVGYAFYRDRPVCEALSFTLGECSPLIVAAFIASSTLFRIHRHYTYGLVYADPEQLARHRRMYIWFPLVMGALLALPSFSGFFGRGLERPLYVALTVIAAPLAAWGPLHVATQKYGILRAYAAKAGYGDARLDRGLLLSWIFLFASLSIHVYRGSITGIVAVHDDVDITFLHPILRQSLYLNIPTSLWAAYATARWVRHERAHFRREGLPRVILVVSTLLMLSTFLCSLIVGYMAVAFNHSIEYIGLVNVYGPRRKSLAPWMKSPWLLNATWFVGVLALYWVIEHAPRSRVAAAHLAVGYTIFTSYVHYLYDGFIWKLRESSVRSAVLAMAAPGEIA